MRLIIAGIFLVTFCRPLAGQEIVFAAGDIARTLALELREQGRKSVAVSTFRDLEGNKTSLGAFFAEELFSQLVAAKWEDLVIVERSRTDAVFEEQRLGIDGLREPGKLDAFVRILEVDALVVGTISSLPELGDRMRINARLIAVPSGQALTSASAFARTDSQPSSPSGPGGDTKSQVTTVNGIKFELLSCGRNGGSVLCRLRLTSIEKDIEYFSLANKSSANASGAEVRAKRVSFGSVQNHRIHAWGNLVAGIPKDGALLFDGIGVSERVLLLVDLRFIVGNDRFSARFKDVDIE